MVIFGVGYLFFIRPRSQAARRQRDTLMELSAGDEVLTGAGIFGTVLDVEADRVTLETAPGTRITVLRSTIARRITDPAAETPSWDEHDEDEAHGAYQEYEHGHTTTSTTTPRRRRRRRARRRPTRARRARRHRADAHDAARRRADARRPDADERPTTTGRGRDDDAADGAGPDKNKT